MSDVEVVRFEVAELDLTPGDTVIIKTDAMLTKDQMEHIRAMVRDALPDDVEILVLSDGLTLEVLRDKREGAKA
jgi:hypothetical protein